MYLISKKKITKRAFFWKNREHYFIELSRALRRFCVNVGRDSLRFVLFGAEQSNPFVTTPVWRSTMCVFSLFLSPPRLFSSPITIIRSTFLCVWRVFSSHVFLNPPSLSNVCVSSIPLPYSIPTLASTQTHPT